MTAFTDDDVTAGGKALHAAWVRMDEGLDLFGKDAHQYLTRAVLTAVAPQIAARARRDEAQRIERAMSLYEAPARVAEILAVADKLQGTPAGYSQEDQDNLGQCGR